MQRAAMVPKMSAIILILAVLQVIHGLDLDIYDGCGRLHGEVFCLGAFDDQVWYPGSGCFKSRICEAVVRGQKNGSQIEWTLAATRNTTLGAVINFAITKEPVKLVENPAFSKDSVNYDWRDTFPQNTLFVGCATDQYNQGFQDAVTGVFYLKDGRPGKFVKPLQSNLTRIYELLSTDINGADPKSNPKRQYTICKFISGLKLIIGPNEGTKAQFNYDLINEALSPTFVHTRRNHDATKSNNWQINNDRTWGSRIETVKPFKLFWEIPEGERGKSLLWLWILLAILLLVIIGIILYFCLRKKKADRKTEPKKKKKSSKDEKAPSDVSVRSKMTTFKTAAPDTY